ncbi:MAG: hypothetical protein Q8N91_02580, partial [Candidatus Omnitrophota bacterium]|nr:hypothetical protein [Candidatus Omnitrophota bacterium]
MRIDVLTLFPGMFRDFLSESIIKRAQKKKKVNIRIHNIRDYSTDKHKKADDKPFGGGPGMVMNIEPIYNALKHIVGRRTAARGRERSEAKPPRRGRRAEQSGAYPKGTRVILLSPQGEKFEQKTAKRL